MYTIAWNQYIILSDKYENFFLGYYNSLGIKSYCQICLFNMEAALKKLFFKIKIFYFCHKSVPKCIGKDNHLYSQLLEKTTIFGLYTFRIFPYVYFMYVYLTYIKMSA